MSDELRSERMGSGLVDVASLGLSNSKWMKIGMNKDWDFIRLPPKSRVQFDNDLTTVNQATRDATESLAPGERGLGIRNTDPRNYPKTIGTGASPGVRMGVPYMNAWVGAAGRMNLTDCR